MLDCCVYLSGAFIFEFFLKPSRLHVMLSEEQLHKNIASYVSVWPQSRILIDKIILWVVCVGHD